MNKIKLKDLLNILACFKVCIKLYDDIDDEMTIIINNYYASEALDILNNKYLDCIVTLAIKEFYEDYKDTYMTIMIVEDQTEGGEE